MPESKLMIVGKKGWLYKDIFKHVADRQLTENVIFTGFVSDDKKLALLKNAKMLVFPSKYEGFGFPILEAFQAGCPVVSAANSSLTEVGGSAVIYIKNENDPKSIAKAMIKMLKLSQAEKNKLIMRGRAQLDHFTWEKAARHIIEIFNKLKIESQIIKRACLKNLACYNYDLSEFEPLLKRIQKAEGGSTQTILEFLDVVQKDIKTLLDIKKNVSREECEQVFHQILYKGI